MPSTVLKEFETIYTLMYPPEEATSDCYAWMTKLPNPMFNAILHCNPESNLSDKVDTLIKQDSTETLSFWSDPKNKHSLALTEILKEKQFQSLGTFPLMAWECHPLPHPRFDIRPADMPIFEDIVSEVFFLDPVTKAGYNRLMNIPQAEHYLVYYENKPVGSGTLIHQGTIGGVFNITVLPEYRGKGLGRAMTQFLMQRSHELGLQKTILLSSPLAEKLYASLGFKKVSDIEMYSCYKSKVV